MASLQVSMVSDFHFCHYFSIIKCIKIGIFFCCLYSTLGGSHGVPRVHYKGRQGDYYIMVCISLLLLIASVLIALESYLLLVSTLTFLNNACRLWIYWAQACGMYGTITLTRKFI